MGLPSSHSPARPGLPVHRSSLIAVAMALTLVATSIAVAGGSSPPLSGRIPPAERMRLKHVTDAPTLATRVDAQPFPARREVFEYLLDHPEFATHVTRALRLGRYRIWRTRDGLFLDDGWGAKGRFEIVHAGSGVRVIHARGEYEQRLLPNIGGEAVVVIEYASRSATGGQAQLATSITGFVKLDSSMLATMTRATGIATNKAEREAQRLAKVFARTSRAIEENPAGVYEILRQRPDVPARDLEGFRLLLKLR